MLVGEFNYFSYSFIQGRKCEMHIPKDLIIKQQEKLNLWRQKYRNICHPKYDIWKFFNQVLSYQQNISQIIDSIIQLKNISICCSKGCSFCCNIPVIINPSEIFMISKRINKFEDSIKSMIICKIKENSENILKIGKDRHYISNIPCCFLINNECSIYSFRPSVCRRLCATDISNCKLSYENPSDESLEISQDVEIFTTTGIIITAFCKLIYEIGLDYHEYELNTALNLVIKSDSYLNSWLKGNLVFPELDPEEMPYLDKL